MSATKKQAITAAEITSTIPDLLVSFNRRDIKETIFRRFDSQIEKMTAHRDGMRRAAEICWSDGNYTGAAKFAHQAAVSSDVLFLTNKASDRYKAGTLRSQGVEAVEEFVLSRLKANAQHSFVGQEGDIYREATATFLKVINLIIT
jgi:hypothetical protein